MFEKPGSHYFFNVMLCVVLAAHRAHEHILLQRLIPSRIELRARHRVRIVRGEPALERLPLVGLPAAYKYHRIDHQLVRQRADELLRRS